MPKDYQQLWKRVAKEPDQGEAVRILTEILADTEGRSFASRLEREQGEVCVGVLDYVSRDLRSLPFTVQTVSTGHHSGRPQTHRAECLRHHVEETC